MRLDIYISTDVLSPRPRQGSYHATWIGFNNYGQKVGQDGSYDSGYGNQYGLLVMALREAADHINQNARPEVRICCKNGLIIQGLKNLRIWEQRDFKRKNGAVTKSCRRLALYSEQIEGAHVQSRKGQR